MRTGMNRSNIAENIMQAPDLEPRRREVLLVQSCCFAQYRVAADLVWGLNTVKPTKIPVGQVMVDDEMLPGNIYWKIAV